MSSEIIADIRKKYEADKEAWQRVYSDARDDLRFLSDDKYAQWDEAAYNERVSSGRPVITIDQLGQFIHQVANEIRMNTPTINVLPNNDEADVETADAMKGIIRGIEYASSADGVYDYASLSSIKCSIGFIRVDHDYATAEGFDQVLKILRVINPLACLIDHNSTEPDGSDARHGTIVEKLSLSEFKRRYPDRDPVCFVNPESKKNGSDDSVFIAEHFFIEDTVRKVAMAEDGTTSDYVDGVPYKRVREIIKPKVRRLIVSGQDVLREGTFPGIYVPLVPVYGDEAWNDGERRILSLIRKSKDPQILFNYWKSLETELLMKAPQAPFMAAEGQVDEYMNDWLHPNKSMVMRYKQTDANGNPAPPPQRLAPPPVPDGVMMASRGVVDDIKATMGIYNASLGQISNETSGIAIARRQQEGSVATFHFGDNLVKSITHVGRILVCAIPEVYDTERVLRIIGKEEKPEYIGVNGAVSEASKQKATIDLSKGKYDVRVTTGAPFTTQRQEAAQFYSDVVTKMPDLMGIMGDLLFKYSDFAGAEAMSERMRKFVDPKYLQDDDDQAPVDPEKAQMKQLIEQGMAKMQVLQKQNEALQMQLKSKQDELIIKAQSERSDAEIERSKVEIQMIELRLQENKNAQDAAVKERELMIKEKELELREAEFLRDTVAAAPIDPGQVVINQLA